MGQYKFIYSTPTSLLLLPEQHIIEDEFAEGKECCLLYEGIYQAERNLCERLGEDENEDVEAILNGMERITRILAMKMYEYGKYGCTARAGNQ